MAALFGTRRRERRRAAAILAAQDAVGSDAAPR